MADSNANLWMKPFTVDSDTVALYHFDEGEGCEAHDACGDPTLTLRSREPLWTTHATFGSAVRFTRRNDDANVFVGPVNHDKLQLRTCTKEWTIEAWVRYTGTPGQDEGHTYATICATDEEGLSLPEGMRGGWTFALLTAEHVDGLQPWARFIGPFWHRHANVQTAARCSPVSADYRGESATTICDQNWHHVAWQFRYLDQTHFLFIDGELVWRFQRPRGCSVINEPRNTCIPFLVGGFLHSQNPPYYLGYGSFEGNIDELRISSVMRYPVSDRLRIVRQTLPEATIGGRYHIPLTTDGTAASRWQIVLGQLPKGITLDTTSGVLAGVPTCVADAADVRLRAVAEDGSTDEHDFSLVVRRGEIATNSLPLAFVDEAYRVTLQSRWLVEPVRWTIDDEALPEGFSFDAATGTLCGTPKATSLVDVTVAACDACGQTVTKTLTLRTVPKSLRHIVGDEHTVAMYDWQGPSGKFFRDVMGDDELTLTWTNMFGDIRTPRAGWGRYPVCEGGGEWGFCGPQHNAKLDLQTCTDAWTVEAWVRRGGPINHYGQPFDFGHICGTFDNSRRGVWELYLAYDGTADGAMSPGVHFVDVAGDQHWMDLHPWKRRSGITLETIPGGHIKDPRYLGIRDTEWHHVAWQYCYAENRHQLFLDGALIWQIADRDGRRPINTRQHEAQFSVGSRLSGYARYGGEFNWLGWGNFFGQIGEIRISNVCRYQ